MDEVAAGRAQSSHSQMLVCETSKELHSYSELFVDVAGGDGVSGSGEAQGAQGEGQEEGVHPTYRSWQWEVFPESHMAAELDFLEGFIH